MLLLTRSYGPTLRKSKEAIQREEKMTNIDIFDYHQVMDGGKYQMNPRALRLAHKMTGHDDYTQYLYLSIAHTDTH